jgi:hypothetical protein
MRELDLQSEEAEEAEIIPWQVLVETLKTYY